MTTLAEKMDMLPEARRRKVEALAEELRADQREALLQEVLAQPDVDEIMRRHESWMERQLEMLRRLPPANHRQSHPPMTTNHSTWPRNRTGFPHG